MPESTKDTETTPRPSSLLKRIVFNRWLLAAVAAICIYALLGFFLAPRLITGFVIDYNKKHLQRQVSLGEVRVNPFWLTVDIKEFNLKESDGRPIMSFGRLFVDFELSSLFHWAYTFADIQLEQPSVHLDIAPNGLLNLAVLAENLPKSENPPPEESQPPRLLIQHASIKDGNFTFANRSHATPAKATLSPIKIEFEEISTLPERKGPYTIRAILPGGGTVGWQGEIGLRPLFSKGHLSVTDFKLATVWRFVQDGLRLDKPEGKISFETAYHFDYIKDSLHLVLKTGNIQLADLKLIEKGQNDSLVAMKSINIFDVGFDLENRLLKISKVRLSDGAISASVTENGVLNWQTLLADNKSPRQSAPTPVPVAKRNAKPPWKLNADTIAVENVALRYKDDSRLDPLDLSVAKFNFSLGLAAEIGNKAPETTLTDLQINLNDVALIADNTATPFIKLDQLALKNGTIDFGKRSIQLPRIAIKGGMVRVIRSKKGRLQIVDAFASADDGDVQQTKTRAAQGKMAPEKSPWSFRLDAFELEDMETLVEDHNTFPLPIKYGLQDIRISLAKITNDGKTPINFDAAFKVAQGGKAKFKGQVDQTGKSIDAKVNLKRLSLKPLQPAFLKLTTLTLKSGNVSTTANLKYRAAKSGLKIRAGGSARIDHFKVNDAATGERVIEWRTLSASGLVFRLAPDLLRIKTIRLIKPGVKVMVSKDGSLNLAGLIKPPDGDDGAKSSQPAPPHPPEKGNDSSGFPVKIASVRVHKGVVDFSDFRLVFPFVTRVTDFNGQVVDISSAAQSRSAVNLEGRVNEFGLATVEGSLSPFALKTLTDIRVIFKNVEMPPLSPYSATFAGRKISSGVLSLDLEYKIRNSELLGENSVVLDRFTLGERVKAPKAINLPLDLAIALLTDTQGKIDIAVPVRGNLDDPKFSYWHLIWQAFLNLITKIVAAPFQALGSLIGAKTEQIDAISFDPGSYHLTPPEQEKLKKVAQALAKRPRLKLVVLGRFDPELDGKALRQERVKRALAIKMKMELAPGEELGPVVFDKAKTQKELEGLLEDRKGKKAVSQFLTAYEKRTGTKAKRINPALGLMGLESKDTAFYEALFKELVKLQPLTEKPLYDLAQKRAEVILEELKPDSSPKEARVAIGESAAVEKPSKKNVKTKLKLDVFQPPK